jgi:hypothetical protein
LATNKEIEDQFSSAVKSALDESGAVPQRFEDLARPPQVERPRRVRAWASSLLVVASAATAAVVVVAVMQAWRVRETPLKVEMAAKAPPGGITGLPNPSAQAPAAESANAPAAAPLQSAAIESAPSSSPAATPAAISASTALTPGSVAEIPSRESLAVTPAPVRRARISRRARARHPAAAIASARGLKPTLPEQSARTQPAPAAQRPAAAVVPPSPPAGSAAARTVLVSSPDHTVYWALEAWGTIFRWTDADNWQHQGTGVRSDLLAGEAPSNTVCWAVGRHGTILLTTDGKRWRQIKSPTNADIIGVSALSADVADIIVSDGSRLSTIDRGGYWMPTI